MFDATTTGPAAGAADGLPAPDGASTPLDQAEIDRLSGFLPADPGRGETGIRAVVGRDAGPREPMPALTRAFEAAAEGLGARFAALVGREVAASLDWLRPTRIGAFADALVRPAHVVRFRADPWGGRGLVAIGPDLARLALDGLLGAAPEPSSGLPLHAFTALERSILSRVAGAALAEAAQAFAAVAPVQFRAERAEAEPRLAGLGPDNAAAVAARIRLAADDGEAGLLFLLPFSTLEPVRAELRQRFPVPAADDGNPWPGHLATAVWRSSLEAAAVLHETRMPLRRVLELGVGDTLMFDRRPSDLVEVRCGSRVVARGRVGQVDGRIAVQVAENPGPAPGSALP